jgi:hypothetical protein
MTLVLLTVGLLAAAAGFVAIGFGIPINAFSLGNTLIIAGTVAAAAGMILIALASAIGQLRRIAEALHASPAARGRAAESIEAILPQTARITPAPQPSPVPTRMTMPPRPPESYESHAPELREAPEPRMLEPRMPEPRMPEPRMPEPPRPPEPRMPTATVASAAAAPGPLDWLRSKPRAAAPVTESAAPVPAVEPAMVEVPDEAPLSPRAPQRQAMPPVPEPAMDPRSWSPDPGNGGPEARPAVQPMPRATPLPQSQPEPSREIQERNGGPFDAVWPERAAATVAEAAAEPPPPMPAARPREEKPAERRVEMAPKPAAERTPAILKSGVIDGMPYTLYADGSIEAELPQGVVKFASVDALRAHLEKHG